MVNIQKQNVLKLMHIKIANMSVHRQPPFLANQQGNTHMGSKGSCKNYIIFFKRTKTFWLKGTLKIQLFLFKVIYISFMEYQNQQNITPFGGDHFLI